jgi:hypothetical protein
MSDRMINRLVAAGVFLVTFFVYMKTLSVTVVFWDVGEFCAASYLLQVPHPPGSPLFLLIARVVSMVPFLTDIAARMHAISAFSSALGVMFLYLVGVKVISKIRGEARTTLDRIIVYGASAIGAFSLAFSTTYWDNAIEAEVYGLSMLFVATITWLIMRWWDRAEEPHNEKYILLIAYLIGLSTGVHLLALLAVFPVMLMIYFRRYEVNRRSFLILGVVTAATFFVIYPGIVQFLPSMLDGEFKGIKSGILPLIPIVALGVIAYGARRFFKTGHKFLHIACLSFLLIVLGYTSYVMVLIRANVPNLPMNENDPSNLERLVSYLSREQYGDTPLLRGESWDNNLQNYKEKLFPRRYSRDAMHEPTRTNYKDDWDFFWRYQTNHMYIRYLFWNFIGQEGDIQDMGVSARDTFAIPFFVGLIGLYYHFRKDWKMGLTYLTMFIVMGVVLAWYQNQQEPQPRERDYFYVGSYFVFALWISVGVIAIIDALRMYLTKQNMFQGGAILVLSLSTAFIPLNLLRINWHEHDRSQNYVAWDYSYNLLQSCEQDAILFTNGDNDTFPLWYLQDVEGVRRDIRIVNLSLVNTSWYIAQLKNQMPHGAKKVPISLSDEQIARIQPIAWKPRQMDIPVSPAVVERYSRADATSQTNVTLTDSSALKDGKITFTMNGIPYSQDIRILRVQDIMVRDIVMSNQWERPIYFAVTCSPDSKIGLDSYLWMQGQAYKLKPFKVPSVERGIDAAVMEANLMQDTVIPAKTPQRGFLFRNLNNPNVYYNENIRRMIINYRASFMRLAYYYMRVENNNEKAKHVLAKMEERIPLSVIPMNDWQFTANMMEIFRQAGDMENYELYATDVERKCLEIINSGQYDPRDASPFQALSEIYEARKDYQSAIGIWQRLEALYPNDQRVKQQIQFYRQLLNMNTAPDTLSQKK